MVERHLKIMDSYVQAPHIHEAAVRSSKMKGGPFMDFEKQRVREVQDLYNKTCDTNKDLLELAAAIKELNNLLEQNARGHSLEPLYERIPDALKGYVELVYDLNNQTSFRFFESLLYKSRSYDTGSQSLALWLTNNDERPFVLSTPKLEQENVILIDRAFSDAVIDRLAAMKREAAPIADLKELLKIPPEKDRLFSSFFTRESPKPYQRYQGDKIRMRYFGHACILIETGEFNILIDPLISYYGYHSQVDHYSDNDLPDEIDYILITHNHQDHILFETLLPLRHKARNIIVPKTTSGSLQDPNVKLILNAIGFKNVIEIGEMESLPFGDCTITGVPFIGEHSDLNVQSKICYHVRIGDFAILFVADSSNVEPRVYEHVKDILGEVDTLFLGMECDGAPLSWLYGPLLPRKLERDKDQSRRLAGSDFNRGRSLVDIFNAKEVYVYAMGQEPWVEFISSIKYTDESNPIVASNKLISYCKNNNVIAERLYGEKELMYDRNYATIE